MKIGSRGIGRDQSPFIIAELSGNHNQSLERALELVEAAAQSKADAVKLQTYSADTMTLRVDAPGFIIEDDKSLWKGRHLYDLYEEAHTPWEWHRPIMDRARELGLLCFSSAFDDTAVEYLEDLDVPAYKIASFENNHLPLIRKVARTGKPVIISTGMAQLSELDEAVRTVRNEGNDQIILLKCTSTYPASPENCNIMTIPHMRDLFDCEVGLSDHTMGTGVAVAAVAHGATVVEKHFTLSRAEGGVDSAFSLEPHELASLKMETERAWQSLGAVCYGPTEAERASSTFRRSLYAASDIAEGEVFTTENMRIVRPGHGLPPRYYDHVLGRHATRGMKKGEPIQWESVLR